MDDGGMISALDLTRAVLCAHWDEIAALFGDSAAGLSEIRCRVEELAEGKVRIRITPGDLDRVQGMVEG